jgi:predicted transcriptional regulator of viral defense system
MMQTAYCTKYFVSLEIAMSVVISCKYYCICKTCTNIKLSLDICASLFNDKSIIIKLEVDSLALPDNLQSILTQNNGIFTTAQANDVGISNERLRLLVKSGELERVSFGVYILPDEFVDKMYVAQLRRPKAIYSHETALFLHDLTDRDPISYTVTVPTGYNATRLRKDGIRVFTIKRELHKLGSTQLSTIFGHKVTAYDLERTICDCLRSRNQMDIAIVTDAIKRYAGRKDKNLNTLMQMAEIFKVTKPLRSYMEVLL